MFLSLFSFLTRGSGAASEVTLGPRFVRLAPQNRTVKLARDRRLVRLDPMSRTVRPTK